MSELDKNEIYLGKKVGITGVYDPSFLRRILRSEERDKVGIKKPLPFVGTDVWGCYEFSFLTWNNLPKNYLLKIVYDSSSPYIVESKSLKIYLGNFSMTQFSKEIEDICLLIESDLSKLLETEVKVYHYKMDIERKVLLNIWSELDSKISKNLVFSDFKRNPSLLEKGSEEEYSIYSDSLKSNCRFTGAPDYGTISIYMKGENLPTFDSLLKYIVSFRGENHFHEEICETVYFDLKERFSLSDLYVCTQYLRRGGIDINVVRTSSDKLLKTLREDFLGEEMFLRTERQ